MGQATRIHVGTPLATGSDSSTVLGAIAIALLFVGGLLAASYPMIAAGFALGRLTVQIARRLYSGRSREMRSTAV